MNNLLLVQPEGSRPRLIKALTANGTAVHEHSFIQIEPLSGDLSPLESADVVVWVSKNAVSFAKSLTLKLPPTVRMYSVGPGTAKLACQQFSYPTQCPLNVHSSEGLLALPELQQLDNQHWCIIKGYGGRELLANSLAQRGAQVSKVNVYQRKKKPLIDAQTMQNWITSVDSIVVTSAEQLAIFLSQVPSTATTWLAQCHWFLPSKRLATLISFVDPSNVTITQSASETTMIETLINHGSDYDRHK